MGNSSPSEVDQSQMLSEAGEAAHGHRKELVDRFIELVFAFRMKISSAAIPASYPKPGHSELTVSQFKALTILRQGQLTVGELAASLGVSYPSATGLMDRLVSKGLAERTDFSSDRRFTKCGVTRGGLDELERTQENIVSKARDLARLFTGEDLGPIARALELLEAALTSRMPVVLELHGRQDYESPEQGDTAQGDDVVFVNRFARLVHALHTATTLMPVTHQTYLDVPASHITALRMLYHNSLSMGQLATSLGGISHRAATGLVDRLVRKGLVKRSWRSADRRLVICSVTAKGLKELTRANEPIKSEIRSLAELFTDEELRMISQAMELLEPVLTNRVPGLHESATAQTSQA